MTNIIVIAHFELANSFANCLEHLFAQKIENLHIIGVKSTHSPDDIQLKASELIKRLGGEILLLSDIFGATPCNIATKLIEPNKVELITGMNLPMLIKAVSHSDKPLSICVEKVINAGQTSIIHVQHQS